MMVSPPVRVRVRSSAVTAPRVAVMVAVPSSVTVGSERVSVVVSVSSLMVTTALSVVTRDSKPPPDAAVTARVSEPGSTGIDVVGRCVGEGACRLPRSDGDGFTAGEGEG